ncbi:tigger transposable element-derived protein 6-like [Mercenaria mercenaria]|uniref:tigger transposable element-derived protein 6-like n=1 Tax=Mercenaria mercenaria TaxID=6596 RepID=UPI00234F70BE|nr:tigger transposable element-derived protein 6-like [Mercenaria mercenaria]
MCWGGKRSKQHITVALCTSMTGEKLKPVVIGKSKKPRCFGSVSVESLPVTYYNNRKAWMLTTTMVDWLKSVDRKMRAQNRKILLFLDNVPVHPDITLSNVKLQFFPPNTTSLLQPMDAGIIQTMKLKYRKRQMQHVLMEMDKHTAKTGPQVLRDITVLETKEVTVIKCFKKCGFGVDSALPVDSTSSENDSSDDGDLDDDFPLAVLKMAQELFGCDMPELIKIDQDFATCDNNMTDWDRPAQEIMRRHDTRRGVNQ